MAESFCGWLDVTGNGESLVSRLKTMAAQLHPGTVPGSPDIRTGPGFGIALTGNRVDKRFHQDDDLVVAINGHPVWLLAENRQAAERAGHAATFAALYAKHGAAVLDHVRGSFSVAVFERASRKALLAVDRPGIYPLCFSHRPGAGLAFGSTATSIAANPRFASDPDPQAILHYLYFHVVPSPVSIYRGQAKLGPAQCLLYDSSEIKQRTYWSPQFTETQQATVQDLEDELHHLLRRAVITSAYENDTGTFLSGGIDSSTITGMLANQVDYPVDAYSIGFRTSGYDEMEFARAAAKYFGANHHEYYVTASDVVDLVPMIAKVYDEPFGNSSAVPVYYCARAAAADNKNLLLAGDGGDELFAGNLRYAKQKLFGIYDKLPAWLRRSVMEPLFVAQGSDSSITPVRKIRNYILQARLPMPDRLQTYNFMYRTPMKDMLEKTFLDTVDSGAHLNLMRETFFDGDERSDLNRMLFLDWKFTLADDDLRKVNRMCELAGVNVEYPLLADEIVEFSTRIPSNLKLRGSRIRYFFKDAMRGYLPEKVLKKSKHGFGLPFGVWMKSNQTLGELAGDSISKLGKRQILKPAYLDRLLKLHRTEHAAYYGEFIWVLMMLELWLESHGYD